jgi:hypothetical protein
MSVPKIKNNVIEVKNPLSSGVVASPPVIHNSETSFSGHGVI